MSEQMMHDFDLGEPYESLVEKMSKAGWIAHAEVLRNDGHDGGMNLGLTPRGGEALASLGKIDSSLGLLTSKESAVLFGLARWFRDGGARPDGGAVPRL